MYETDVIINLNSAFKYAKDAGIKNYIRRAALRQTQLMFPMSKPGSVGHDELMSNVRRIFTSEGKIPAIKYHRNNTGIGLKESREWVESACADLRAPY